MPASGPPISGRPARGAADRGCPRPVIPTFASGAVQDIDLLVGLTATPERADGKSLLPDFDGHIGAELRLWHALDDQLLVPFEYYGISDGVDLRGVRWSRTGYDEAALGDLYTGHDARAELVRHQLARRVASVRAIRALGFCVSVEHAKFMAKRFTEAGIPSLAVYGEDPDGVRGDAPRLLRDRTVNVLFTCDLYNEGVDLPYVDTLLLLRPTQGATLFLQQLGRGLRYQASELVLLASLADPFDRLIVAAARRAGVPLITADTTIDESALVRRSGIDAGSVGERTPPTDLPSI